MQEENDILDKIFVNKNEPVDKKLLVEVLNGYVTIDSEGRINYSEKYDQLVGHKKVLIYFCSKKAMILRNIPEVKESTSQSEVSENAHVTLDIARNAIHKKYKKLLKKERDGYVLPNYNLRKIKEIFGDNKND